MRFSPSQKHVSLLITVYVILFIAGSAAYFFPTILASLGRTVPPFPFTCGAVICFIALIFLFLRYRMTGFEYVIRPRDDGYVPAGAEAEYASDGSAPLDFVVYKSMGARQGAMECVLSIGDFRELIELKKGERTKTDVMKAFCSDGFTYYDYTLTFLPTEAVELIFADGEKFVGIIIEDGNEIADYFRKISK